MQNCKIKKLRHTKKSKINLFSLIYSNYNKIYTPKHPNIENNQIDYK